MEKIVITKTDVRFENLSFLVTAVCKDKYEDNICGIHAEEYFLYCTDGYRIHIIPNDIGCSPGFYEILKKTKSEISLLIVKDAKRYPDIDSLCPDPDKFEDNSISLHKRENDSCSDTIFIADVFKKTNNVYNYTFLNDVPVGPYQAALYCTADNDAGGKRHILVLTDDFVKTAIIMPILDD